MFPNFPSFSSASKSNPDHMDGSPLSEISEAPNKHIREAEEHKDKLNRRKMRRKSSWPGVLREKGLSCMFLFISLPAWRTEGVRKTIPLKQRTEGQQEDEFSN